MGRIIAVVNQKGGVGKTTTAVNLASYLAEMGQKVLLVDIDPQGNSTLGFGFDKQGPENDVYEALIGTVPLKNAVRETEIKGLDIVPADIDLTGAEVELVNMEGRETKLKEALASVKNSYDLIFIDSPPSLGLLTLNALVAADSALIPMQCEFYALDGLAQLLNTIDNVRRSLNPDITIEGVLITMFDSRTNLAVQVVEEIKKKFGDRVYETLVPRNVKLSEAPSFGKPINLYDRSSRGSVAYKKLAEEMLGIKTK